jgi:hypothetical protein
MARFLRAKPDRSGRGGHPGVGRVCSYGGSVEDRVHQVLADRLASIHQLFGQIPDTLEDVWVQVAMKQDEEAQRLIDRTTATRNPFDAKYSKVEDADWETCSLVLDPLAVREQLSRGW